MVKRGEIWLVNIAQRLTAKYRNLASEALFHYRKCTTSYARWQAGIDFV